MMQKLLKELRRRNVFRVAGVYLVIAWLVIQVVANVAPMLGLPAWFGKAVLVLLAAGFPIAVVFAWAFELTPEGLKRTANVPESQSIAAKTGRKLDYAILAGLALAVIIVVADRLMPPFETREAASASQDEVGGAADQGLHTEEGAEAPVTKDEPQAPPPAASIAVLPFADMSETGDQGYFADGITEEILNVLAKRLPELKVAGRTSSFQFKNVNEDLRVIGGKLGVAHILEGSVRKQGDAVRITAQLIRTEDGFHVWSNAYDRRLDNVFAVQDEISRAVADALSIEMGGGKSGIAATGDAMAHDLYLRARQFLAARGDKNLENAALLFEAAAMLDPDYSSAWSGRARALSLLLSYSGDIAHTEEWHADAVDSAQTAIAIDPDNAEAHSALGVIYATWDWDWRKAREVIETSAELAPNDAEIANFVGDFYKNVLDEENALRWERKAAELDPLFNVHERDLGIVLVGLGRCKEAVRHFRRAAELGSDSPLDLWTLAFGQICAGETGDARETLSALHGEAPTATFTVEELEARLAIAEGRTDDALAIAGRIEKYAEDGAAVATILAVIFADLGEYERAARWFEESYRRREYGLVQPDIFALPERWPDHPALRAALDKPELNTLFDIRRQNLANRSATKLPNE